MDAKFASTNLAISCLLVHQNILQIVPEILQVFVQVNLQVHLSVLISVFCLTVNLTVSFRPQLLGFLKPCISLCIFRLICLLQPLLLYQCSTQYSNRNKLLSQHSKILFLDLFKLSLLLSKLRLITIFRNQPFYGLN